MKDGAGGGGIQDMGRGRSSTFLPLGQAVSSELRWPPRHFSRSEPGQVSIISQSLRSCQAPGLLVDGSAGPVE